MLCVYHTTPTQKLFCLQVLRQAGSPQRVDCLAQRWETALSPYYKSVLKQDVELKLAQTRK